LMTGNGALASAGTGTPIAAPWPLEAGHMRTASAGSRRLTRTGRSLSRCSAISASGSSAGAKTARASTESRGRSSAPAPRTTSPSSSRRATTSISVPRTRSRERETKTTTGTPASFSPTGTCSTGCRSFRPSVTTMRVIRKAPMTAISCRTICIWTCASAPKWRAAGPRWIQGS
jgi:hypothetical protein